MGNITLPKPTLLDRVIGEISPGWMAARLQRRVAVARYEGLRMDGGMGYDAADLRRQARAAKRREGSADKAILRDVGKLRGQSHDLVRNMPIASGALENIATKVVGRGLKLKARPDRKFLGLRDDQAAKWEAQAERLWAHFCAKADYQRRLSLEMIEFVVLYSMLEDGDHFVVLTGDRNPGDLFDMKLQLVEAARVCNPHLRPDRPELAGGIEYDLTGKPTAAHIADRFPYDYGRGPEPAPNWTRVPLYGATSGRRNVLQIMMPTRANQTRGVPVLSSVIEALSQLGEYTRAELTAAVVNSCFALVTKTEGGSLLPETDAAPVQSSGNPTKMGVTFEPGMVLEGLSPNESVSSFTPSRPSANFDPFYLAMCRNIAVGLGLSTGTLLRHFTASYSASRGELLEVWEIVHRRRAHFAAQFHQPLYEEMLAEALDAGVIIAPGWDDPLYRAAWCNAGWIGPSQGQLNPKDEVQAAALLVAGNFSTEEEQTARLTGGDYDSNMEQRAREVKTAIAAGTAPSVTTLGADPNRPGQAPSGEPVQGSPAALPAPTGTETEPGDSEKGDGEPGDNETPAAT